MARAEARMEPANTLTPAISLEGAMPSQALP